MVEIIKQGQLPEDKVYQVKCKNCKTEFTFKRSEGRVERDQRWDGIDVVIKCPLPGCNEIVRASL